MRFRLWKLIFASISATLLLFGFLYHPENVSANHSWSDYHWARTSNPFTLQLGDNVSGLWDSMLVTASNDWAQSSVLDTSVVPGATKPKACQPTNGRVEVCSASYGNTGWLGLAQIWITTGDHIAQGVVKNNDFYFGNSSYTYNNTAEMQHVICQEIGHTLGLDHQSTDGSSLNTCMDYYHNSSASDTLSTHPNQHDYDELGIIYGHLDSFTTVIDYPPPTSGGGGGNGGNHGHHGNSSFSAPVDMSSPSEWGKLVKSEPGKFALYERDFGNGNKVSTYVILAE